MTAVILVGVPDDVFRERIAPQVADDDVMPCATLLDAARELDAHPDAAVAYGPDLFGEAVTGQPCHLDARLRVVVTDDLALDTMAWDDPRRLVWQAAMRLHITRVVDVSRPGAVASLLIMAEDARGETR